jgi:hypothetical protein
MVKEAVATEVTRCFDLATQWVVGATIPIWSQNPETPDAISKMHTRTYKRTGIDSLSEFPLLRHLIQRYR